DGRQDVIAQRLGWLLDQQVRPVVVADHEHLGRDLHADGVPLAEGFVDLDAHSADPLTRVPGRRIAVWALLDRHMGAPYSRSSVPFFPTRSKTHVAGESTEHGAAERGLAAQYAAARILAEASSLR